MVFTKAYVLPILFGFWVPATVFITYTISVLTNHVVPVLPYISDTGTWAPESCIFGILLTLGALMMLSITYIRYRQVVELRDKFDFTSKLRILNQLSLYSGIICVFGCLVVANFQVRLIFVVHILGAGVCFGFGTLFQIIQAIISFKLYPIIGKKSINICRVVFATTSALSFVTTFICAVMALSQFTGDDMTKWKPNDGGYEVHLASAVAEYVLAFSTVLHIVTFVEEFRMIEIRDFQIDVKTK